MADKLSSGNSGEDDKETKKRTRSKPSSGHLSMTTFGRAARSGRLRSLRSNTSHSTAKPLFQPNLKVAKEKPVTPNPAIKREKTYLPPPNEVNDVEMAEMESPVVKVKTEPSNMDSLSLISDEGLSKSVKEAAKHVDAPKDSSIITNVSSAIGSKRDINNGVISTGNVDLPSKKSPKASVNLVESISLSSSHTSIATTSGLLSDSGGLLSPIGNPFLGIPRNDIDEPISLPFGESVLDTNGGVEDIEDKMDIENTHNYETTASLLLNDQGNFKDQICLIQLPSVLPRDDFKQEDNDQNSYPVESLTCDKNGEFGKLRIHKSGKVTLAIGDVVFNVDSGIQRSFQQELVVIDTEERTYVPCGKVPISLVATPDFASLLGNPWE